MSNSSIVQDIYAAFGKGDVPGILSHVSENVDWDYGGQENDIPWLKHRQGHRGAAEFFTSLQDLEFHKFQPTAIIESNNIVVALVDLEATVKATGKKIVEEDEVHIWHFENGKVVRFRHRVDTLLHYNALRS